jgi:hypothetical protein
MRVITPVSSCIALCIAAPLHAGSPDAADLFDKPVKVERIALPKDPLNPRADPSISCFHYPVIRVRQIDRGEKGAEMFLLPLDEGRTPPECSEENAPAEKPVDEWSGYFKGFRAGYVFFDADDGWNDGVGFAVFAASSRRKIFDDVAGDIHSIDPAPSGLVLRYQRVYGAPCSLYADPTGCWNTVMQATGLTGAAPDCASAYRAEIEQAGERVEEAKANPTVIIYEAETVLRGMESQTRPQPGKVTCRPAV